MGNASHNTILSLLAPLSVPKKWPQYLKLIAGMPQKIGDDSNNVSEGIKGKNRGPFRPLPAHTGCGFTSYCLPDRMLGVGIQSHKLGLAWHL